MSFPRLLRQLVTGVAGNRSDGGKAGNRETSYVIPAEAGIQLSWVSGVYQRTRGTDLTWMGVVCTMASKSDETLCFG